MMNYDLPCTVPDNLECCQHYNQQLVSQKEMESRLPSVTFIRNPGGAELECYTLQFLIEQKRDDIESFKDSDDIEPEDYAAWESLLSTYEGIAETPLNDYSLHEKALQFATVFRVSPKAFNSHEDIECAINQKQIRRISQLHALRSFAWTAKAYCEANHIKESNLSEEDLARIGEHIANRIYLNYQSDDIFQVLYDFPDKNVYFIPEAAVMYVRIRSAIGNLSVAFGADSDDEDEAWYNLDALREDLELLEPLMEKVHAVLFKKRDTEKLLEGALSDVLFAWCTLANAASTVFFLADGPSTYIYSQCTQSVFVPDAEQNKDAGKTKSSQSQRSNTTESTKSISQKQNASSPTSKTKPVRKYDPKDLKIEDGVFKEYNGRDLILVIPEGVTAFDEDFSALYDSELTDIYFPDSLKTIPNYCFFSRYSSLRHIDLGHGIERIGDHAFDGCPITEVVIPDSVQDIGKSVFSPETVIKGNYGSAAEIYAKENIGCKYILEGTDPELSKTYNTEKTTLQKNKLSDFVIQDGCLLSYIGTSPTVVIPSGINTIRASAFSHSKVVEQIIGHSSDLKTIESGSFVNCARLRSLDISIPEIVEGTIQNCPVLCSITFENTKSIAPNAIIDCPSLEWIMLPKALKTADNDMIDKCPRFSRFRIAKSNVNLKTHNGILLKRIRGEKPKQHDATQITEDKIQLDENVVLQKLSGIEYICTFDQYKREDYIDIDCKSIIGVPYLHVSVYYNDSKEWMFFEEGYHHHEGVCRYAVLDYSKDLFAELNISKYLSYDGKQAWSVTVSAHFIWAKDRSCDFICKRSSISCRARAEMIARHQFIPAIKAVLQSALLNGTSLDQTALSEQDFKYTREEFLEIIKNKPYSPSYPFEVKNICSDSVCSSGKGNSKKANANKKKAVSLEVSPPTEENENSTEKNSYYFVFAEYSHHEPVSAQFSFPGEMAIHVDPEDSSVVSFFSWKASNKPDYEDITSRSGDVEGIASTANFSCLVTDRSSGSEIGGLYDALAENYSDHEEKINKLYADLNDPLLNSVCVRLSLCGITPIDNGWKAEMVCIDYGSMSLSRDCFDLAGEGQDVINDILQRLANHTSQNVELSAPGLSNADSEQSAAPNQSEINIAEFEKMVQGLDELANKSILHDYTMRNDTHAVLAQITTQAYEIVGDGTIFNFGIIKFEGLSAIEKLRQDIGQEKIETSEDVIMAIKQKKLAEFEQLDALRKKKEAAVDAILNEEQRLKNERSKLGLFQGKRKKEIAALLELIPRRIKQVEEEYEKAKSKF